MAIGRSSAILDNLTSAAIAVADMTPTSVGFGGWLNPNSIVIREYTFAQVILGVDNVIAVMDLEGIQFNRISLDFNHLPLVGFRASLVHHLKGSLKTSLQSIVNKMLRKPFTLRKAV